MHYRAKETLISSIYCPYSGFFQSKEFLTSGKILFMAVLITGGAGYIGSHTIVEIMEKTGEKVISIDNYSNSSPKAYDGIQKITGVNPLHYDVDLTDKEAILKILKAHTDISGIIHFAAHKSVPESVKAPLEYYRNNILSLINILDCQNTLGIPHFIFSSSCSVYGNSKELPVTESSDAKKAESPYGATKVMGEQITKDYTISSPAAKAISLRYFNPAGAHPSALLGEQPFERPSNLVPAITQSAAGKTDTLTIYGDDYDTRDGTCIRDYIHVSDIARAHVLALNYLRNNERAKTYDVFNLGTGNGVTVLEAIKAFEIASGENLNYEKGKRRAGDVEAIYANKDKARDILNWSPSFSLEQIMKTAWDWEKKIE